MNPNRIRGSDDENRGFVIPEKILDQKSGFDKEVAKLEDESGNNIRRRPTELNNIPQISLAERVKDRRMKEGH